MHVYAFKLSLKWSWALEKYHIFCASITFLRNPKFFVVSSAHLVISFIVDELWKIGLKKNNVLEIMTKIEFVQ